MNWQNIPERDLQNPPEKSWFPLIALVVIGLTGGLMFGMAKHGVLTGPWALLPVGIFAALAVGRIVELRRNRRRGDKGAENDSR